MGIICVCGYVFGKGAVISMYVCVCVCDLPEVTL